MNGFNPFIFWLCFKAMMTVKTKSEEREWGLVTNPVQVPDLLNGIENNTQIG